MRATARVRTECLFLTEEVLCQVSYGGMAGEAGFEPALQGSKPSGLPITPFPRAQCRSRTRDHPLTKGLLCHLS